MTRRKKGGDLSYKIVAISLYHKDIEEISEKVAALRAGGHTTMNRSKLIRIAVRQLNLKKVPKQH